MKKIRPIDDPYFLKLFLRILSYRLSSRQIKYFIFRFYYNMDCNKIAYFDSRRVSSQRINAEFEEAYKKIRQEFKKKHSKL